MHFRIRDDQLGTYLPDQVNSDFSQRSTTLQGVHALSVKPFFLATAWTPWSTIDPANNPQVYINDRPYTQTTQSSSLEHSQDPVTRIPLVYTKHTEPER